jgi:hypothetical protein
MCDVLLRYMNSSMGFRAFNNNIYVILLLHVSALVETRYQAM